MSLSKKDKAAALKRLLALRKAKDNFIDFVRLLHPDWNIPQFHLDLAATLDSFGKDQLAHPTTKAPVRNLMINMPPRHAKSTFCTELFPAWYMLRDPRRFIMTTSYNNDLARGFGQNVLANVKHPEAQKAFTDFALNPKRQAPQEWATEAGGVYYGIGVGGTTVGRAANLLIIDDPIRSREEAESPTMRNKVWDFYVGSLSTRMQPEVSGLQPRQIVIQTRWHTDDLSGRIMELDEWQEEEWLHLNIPARREVPLEKRLARMTLPETHELYLPIQKWADSSEEDRYVGPGTTRPDATLQKALWPGRGFDLEWLQKRERLSPHEFHAQYQQSPYIRGGGIIKDHYWTYYEPERTPDAFASLIIGVDTAFTKTSRSNYTVALVAGLTQQGDMYILEVDRGRWESPELKRRLVHLNNRWRGKGLRGFYIESVTSGTMIIQELRRDSGINVLPYQPRGKGDKEARVHSILPFLEGGRVLIPSRAKWLDTFVEECTAFPSAKYDDQVDALSMTIDVLSRQHLAPFEDQLASTGPLSTSAYGSSLNDQLGNLGQPTQKKKSWAGFGMSAYADDLKRPIKTKR